MNDMQKVTARAAVLVAVLIAFLLPLMAWEYVRDWVLDRIESER